MKRVATNTVSETNIALNLKTTYRVYRKRVCGYPPENNPAYRDGTLPLLLDGLLKSSPRLAYVQNIPLRHCHVPGLYNAVRSGSN